MNIFLFWLKMQLLIYKAKFWLILQKGSVLPLPYVSKYVSNT